ncbi:MAG: hypothetical protein CM1200mP28_15590 [Deltaproteobacteria bacterium]|nr:MAG: hypothetical protein CM1200mP28_15590 [Deltaproteobacteria bacterium]
MKCFRSPFPESRKYLRIKILVALGLEWGLFCWAGDCCGSVGGKTLLNYYSFLGKALSFAFPSLFLASLSMLEKGRRLRVLPYVAVFHWNGHSEMGIIAAAFIGPSQA